MNKRQARKAREIARHILWARALLWTYYFAEGDPDFHEAHALVKSYNRSDYYDRVALPVERQRFRR